MSVHVGEIRTELSATRGNTADASDASGEGAPQYPGVREDEWQGLHARILLLRKRVCAEGFDD